MRRGATLLELLVALTLAAIVLGTATGSVLRQQRSAAGQDARLRAEVQLRSGGVPMAASLLGLAPAAGDLVAAEARDTAVQLRAAMANGFACDSAVALAALAAGDGGDASLTGVAAMPKAGDTLWWYRADSASWSARRITDVSEMNMACPFAGSAPSPVLRLAFAGTDSVPRGAPLRVTRQVRYSIYRASDGSWQVGLGEWSDVLHAFTPPQPIAGPFLRVIGSGTRTGFRYFDADGVEMQTGTVDASRVARMRITMLSIDRATGAARGESTDVAFAPAH